MKRTTTTFLLSVVLLLALGSIATAQIKARSKTAKPAAKPVTITLVRWPYT